MAMLEREDFQGGNSARLGPPAVVALCFVAFVLFLVFGAIWLNDRDIKNDEKLCLDRGVLLNLQTRLIDDHCYAFQDGRWAVL